MNNVIEIIPKASRSSCTGAYHDCSILNFLHLLVVDGPGFVVISVYSQCLWHCCVNLLFLDLHLN